MERKGFGIRLGALLIDVVILIIIQVIISVILLGSINVSFGSSGTTAVSAEDVGKIRMAGIISGLLGLAYGTLEIFRAQSVGKMALGLKIGSETGTVPAVTGTLAMRYLVKYSPNVINLLALITGVGMLTWIGGLAGLAFFIGCFFTLGQKRQALHDMIAKTAVYGVGRVGAPGFQPVMQGGGTTTPPPAM